MIAEMAASVPSSRPEMMTNNLKVGHHVTVRALGMETLKSRHNRNRILPSARRVRTDTAMFSRFIHTTSYLARPATSIPLVTVFPTLTRGFASASSPIHSLLLIEHRSGQVEGATLAALTAAAELGGKVTGLVIGAPGGVEGVVEKVKKSV
jgi:hypothetical protein